MLNNKPEQLGTQNPERETRALPSLEQSECSKQALGQLRLPRAEVRHSGLSEAGHSNLSFAPHSWEHEVQQ